MIAILLALQTAGACAAGELCRTLEAAALVNQVVAGPARGYRAVVETESATLSHVEGRVEGASILEQVSSTVHWSSDGSLVQHLAGWRSSTNAVPLTRLAVLRIGWLVPITGGERLTVLLRSGPARGGKEQLGPGDLSVVIHPLASDRESFYRFTGGTEARRSIDGIERRVIVVEVTPVAAVSAAAGLFQGEMNLDPETHGLVRLYGRFLVAGRPGGGMPSLDKLSRQETTLVDLVNQQLPDGSWVPRVQRFEIESVSSRTWGYGSALRIISRFHEVTPQAGGGSGFTLSSAPGDSLRRFEGWRASFGSMTEAVSRDDFGKYRRLRLQPSGPPVLTFQGYLPGEFVRINKVEGIFTGASLLLRLRDALPGVGFLLSGGYAWHEKTVRGRAGVGLRAGSWTLEAGAARSLEATNKFRDQFDNPVLSALAGRDNWDYLERRGGGIYLTRLLDWRGSVIRLDAAGISDRAVTRHMTRSLAGWRLRDNRGIMEGSYFRTRALLEWNPEVSPVFAKDGVGFRGEVEHAGGDLDYTRVETRLVGRTSFGRVTLLARLHAGAVFADHPPPQQLFEIGGPAGLPGYEYKEFAGDRAALFRTRISYALPMLDTRSRGRNGGTLPALAPALSIGFSAGVADVRTAGGAAAVAALGVKRDDKTGELVINPVTGQPFPAAVAGGKLHPSLDIRLGLFGDALAVGFARALEQGRANKFIFAFGRQF